MQITTAVLHMPLVESQRGSGTGLRLPSPLAITSLAEDKQVGGEQVPVMPVVLGYRIKPWGAQITCECAWQDHLCLCHSQHVPLVSS